MIKYFGDNFNGMKIFTAAQIRACDAYTMTASGMRSYDLMERAAVKCANWVKENLPADTLFVILCGTGNNGGDGFAIARILHQRGYAVKAFLLRMSAELSPDCNANMHRLQVMDSDLVTIVEPDTFITDLPPYIVIIDAIFGTGLSRPIHGWMETFIHYVNQIPNIKIAIDMPSGLPTDAVPDKDTAVVIAHETLSFQFYKRSFLHPESGLYTGNIHILDIGLDKDYINATQTNYKTIDKEYISSVYRPRNKYAHKGNFGSALMIGGSYGRTGAICLSTKATLRAGAGLVTALVPSCGYVPLQTYTPEAMCIISGEKAIEKISGWETMNAIGIGPGMGMDRTTLNALSEFLDTCKIPVVVDADALNLIASHTDLLGKLPKGSVLTPHPKEFSRMFGENTSSMIQTDNARIQAMRYNINIVLKGHHTAVITPEGECRYNMTGNAGMATGGSGDVLTGIITGLIACGYDPTTAATIGVYIHGVAGDMAAKELSMEGMIAGDIIQYLGKAFLGISS